jgi:hypothetical protein
MTPNRGLGRDLISLWFEAPMVIAMRTQAAAMEMMTGGSKSSAEFNRMVTEKMAATAESMVALNLAFVQQAVDASFAMASGRKPASAGRTAEKIAEAAVKPYSKRVRSNVRRLSVKKD